MLFHQYPPPIGRCFGSHDLTNELLLSLNHLIEVAVECILCYIGVNLNFRVLIALTDNAAFALL